MKEFKKKYDVVVVGSGLAGLTSANCLAKHGRSVLLLEQHFQLGGLATWFKRPGGFIFDVSLHGFPCGMIKSCRRYWNSRIADSIIQLKNIRFENPQFRFATTFDRQDFTDKLVHVFGVSNETVEKFFEHLRQMNFYDDDKRSTRELFETFFPGREDVHRLLMEPISYANGSSLDDPAITYGIVFSNFMHKGVFTFQGGTDCLIQRMEEELKKNGVTIVRRCLVEKLVVDIKKGRPKITGVIANGEKIECDAVMSNANLKTTIEDWLDPQALSDEFLAKTKTTRINNSSCQVYIGLKPEEKLPEIGDLIFTSEDKHFSSEELKALRTRSRTFSIYYPSIRPESKSPRYTVVSSTNALWKDWDSLSDENYSVEKKRLVEDTLNSLENFVPNVRSKIEWLEVATPRTFQRYTRHVNGASFGTKFEGLNISMELPKQVGGLYHAGSVGIIMSGWLGTINYGVIVADKVEKYLLDMPAKPVQMCV